ncbi:hypothetical protein [Wolbachia endosymbiont of Rhagoletis cingulata]
MNAEDLIREKDCYEDDEGENELLSLARELKKLTIKNHEMNWTYG